MTEEIRIFADTLRTACSIDYGGHELMGVRHAGTSWATRETRRGSTVKAVYKYVLTDVVGEAQHVPMQVGAEIVSCQVQRGNIMLWAIVDLDAELEVRHFLIEVTGYPLPGNPVRYLGTVQLEGGTLVFHVFELVTTRAEHAASVIARGRRHK